MLRGIPTGDGPDRVFIVGGLIVISATDVMARSCPFAAGTAALLVVVLAGCGSGAKVEPVGRYEMKGELINTDEVSGSSMGCGPQRAPRDLAGFFTVSRTGKDSVSIHDEGPGCTVEAHAKNDHVFVADGQECVLDPEGPYKMLGFFRVLYQSYTLDFATLEWSYDVVLTWPSAAFPDGMAKVCGRGQATLTREMAAAKPGS